MDIVEFVKKAKEGDGDALVQLIMHKKDEYYKLAYVYLENQEDALDALEDMIVIIYEKLFWLRKNESFDSWSKVILVNCCKKILKSRKKLVHMAILPETGHEGFIQNKENQLLVEEYLKTISPKQQEAIRLKYLADLDYETIAQILKVPIGTVKSRISIGLKRMQELVGGDTDA